MTKKRIRLPRVLSLRWELTFWFGGLSLITLLIVGYYIGGIATRSLVNQSGENLYLRAKSAVDLLQTNLSEREQEIYLLSRSPLFQNNRLNSVDVRQVLELRQQASQEYAWIGVADVAGRVVQSTGGLLVGASVDQRPWFQQARQGRFIGDIHEAILLAKKLSHSDTDQPLRFIDFAAPILGKDGELRGVLGAHAHWHWVTDTVESIMTADQEDTGIQLLITDRNGQVLYPFTLVDESRLPANATAHHSYRRLLWPDGRQYLTAVLNVNLSSAPDLDWRIVVRQPLDTALEPARELRNRLWILGLLAALCFAGVAYRLATRISRPLEQLVIAANAIEKRREPSYPEAIQTREVRQLVWSFRQVTRSLLHQEHLLTELNNSLESQVAERTRALTLANLQLEQLAVRDGLTGVANRRSFDEKLEEWFSLFKRTQLPFTLLLVDADLFKRINDQYGHAQGDNVLRHLARLLTQQSRETDFVARYGGEEFCVILPNTPAQPDGRLVAEKIRTAVETHPFPGELSVTVSIGLSQPLAEDTRPEALFERADQALYRAKASGRNQSQVG